MYEARYYRRKQTRKMVKGYHVRRNLFKRRRHRNPINPKQISKALATVNKVPFGCNACSFSSFSIRKFVLHVKDHHYVAPEADKDVTNKQDTGNFCEESSKEAIQPSTSNLNQDEASTSNHDAIMSPESQASSPGLQKIIKQEREVNHNDSLDRPISFNSSGSSMQVIDSPNSALDYSIEEPAEKTRQEKAIKDKVSPPKSKSCRLNLENIVHNLKDHLTGSSTQTTKSKKKSMPGKESPASNQHQSASMQYVVVSEGTSVSQAHNANVALNSASNLDAPHSQPVKVAQVDLVGSQLPTLPASAPFVTLPRISSPTSILASIVQRGVVTMPNISITSYIESNPKIQGLLNESFSKFPYPPVEEIYYLSNATKLSAPQIKSWFVGSRLKHGISWSPDEVMEAWSCISGQGVGSPPQPLQTVTPTQPYRGQTIVPNPAILSYQSQSPTTASMLCHPTEPGHKDSVRPPPQRMPPTQGEALPPNFPLNPRSLVWMTCNCGLEHEVKGSQICLLNSMGEHLTEMPSLPVLTEAEQQTGLPPCAVRSFFQGKCEINNKEENVQAKQPGKRRSQKTKQSRSNESSPASSGTSLPKPAYLDILFQSFCLEPFVNNEEIWKLKASTGFSQSVIKSYFANKRKDVILKLQVLSAEPKHIAIYESYQNWMTDIQQSKTFHQQSVKLWSQ